MTTDDLRALSEVMWQRAGHEEMAARVLSELERSPNIRNAAMISESLNRALVAKAFRDTASAADAELRKRDPHD